MTYNNPVFVEQCKLRKIEIDESGFVEQIPLDKKEKLLVKEVDEDEEDEDDDDFDEDDDIEDEIFKRPSKKPVLQQPKQHIPEIKPPTHEDVDDIEGNEIAFKIGGSKVSASTAKEDEIKASPTKIDEKPKITPVAPPSITTEELAELFGRETSNEEPKIEEPKLSVRDRMNEELNDVKPTLKLNISKNSSNSSNTSTKPKIKLNINSKQ